MTSPFRSMMNDPTADRKRKRRGSDLDTAAAQTRVEVQMDKKRTVRERIGYHRRETTASTVQSVSASPSRYLFGGMNYMVMGRQSLERPVLTLFSMPQSPHPYTWRDCEVLLHYMETESEGRDILSLRQAAQRHAELVRSDV